MNGVSNLLVSTSYVCEFIPLVSSATNLVELFLKCAVLPFMDKATIASNHYYKHIDEKSFSRCILLVIPIIGNIIVGIYDLYMKNFDSKQDMNALEQQVKAIAQTPINSLKAKLVCFYKTGPTEFLGNFANCPQGVQVWGHSFKCSEAAFQWRKYHLAARDNKRQDLLNDSKMQKFFTCNGEEAFRLNRELEREYQGVFPSGWRNGIRDQVMWDTLNAKFQQNAFFSKLLKSTQGAYLLEHNEASRDNYWSDNSDGSGKNMLGKMLMALRDARSCPPTNDSSDQARIQTYANYANQSGALNYQIF